MNFDAHRDEELRNHLRDIDKREVEPEEEKTLEQKVDEFYSLKHFPQVEKFWDHINHDLLERITNP